MNLDYDACLKKVNDKIKMFFTLCSQLCRDDNERGGGVR